MKSWGCVGLCVTLICALSEPVLAQAKEGVSALSEAEQQALLVHLREAREAYERGEYARALTSYESAYRIEPLPSIWFFRGQILERLGQDEEAILAYERFVEAAPEDERVALATRSIEVLRARQVVTFHIETRPPGAQVHWLEDGEQKRGTSPLSVEARAGQVLTFHVELEGFSPLHKKVTFERGGALIWEPTLAPLPEEPALIAPRTTHRLSSQRGLWIGASASAVVSTVGFLVAANAGRKLDEADTMRGEPGSTRPSNYDALRRRHNLGVAVGWLGVVSASSCVGLALLRTSRDTSLAHAWHAGFTTTRQRVGLSLNVSF